MQGMTEPATTRTTCPYCGVGCGVLATVETDGGVRVSGDPQHPANFGRLCSKGAALAETLDAEGRLLHPVVNGEQVSWDAALDRVADGFSRVIAQHGPDAVAFYVSGQLLTEDYYVANKLMKGFIGSANIDTNSRLCMSSAVAAHQRAFGEDVVPVCYEDIEAADLVVIVGANPAWAHPVLYQRLAAAKQARHDMRVVVVDPRRTATCDIADLHLAVAPGSDAYLFNGLLHYLRRADALDLDFVEAHVEGFAAAFAAAREMDSVTRVAKACGVTEAQIGEFFRLFAETGRCVTIFSQGINQSSSGVDKANAIINVHLATGRIGRLGMGPFSITGQPNAMGGREVGGLANQLAAHMDFSDPAAIEAVADFWNAQRIATTPGLKAVEMFRAVEAGKIRALWIMGTNPAVSMPDAERVRAALRDCELVVVSDCVRHTDTTACADILLPAAGWGEKDGTVTNSERRISRQRPFLAPAGEARPDWWIITQVAQRLGFDEAFPYTYPAQIFREHARLSKIGRENGHAFDIGALSGLDDTQYDALQPVQWPAGRQMTCGAARLFTDRRFHTISGKARMIAIMPQLSAIAADGNFPLVLNSGRIRDQWHTMTRTGKVSRLNAHQPEPYVQIHARDAALHYLQDGGLARLTSRHGSMLARVRVSGDQRIGAVFVPMHWSDAFAKAARVNALVAPITDPVSGQPEFKHTPVRIEPYRAVWHGFVLSRERLDLPQTDYCACSRGDGYWRHEVAGEVLPDDSRDWVRSIWRGAGDWQEYRDAAMGRYRAACLRQGRLEAVFFIAPDQHLPEREWVGSLFRKAVLDAVDMNALLTGRLPKGSQADAGRTLCACFGVGEKTILHAIREQGLCSVESIGQALKAGSGCGSCVPELRRMLEQH
jgi:assimilatory nitrate reductase catalytic subunit